MVKQRGELCFLIPVCGLTYSLQLTRRADSGSVSGTRFTGRVPFSQTPSLHPLRHRTSGFVRGLLRYYESVRLPVFVHRRLRRLTSRYGPTLSGKHGTSRFLSKVCPYVLRVFDRAGLPCSSRWRCIDCCLPPGTMGVGVPKFECFRSSMSRPVLSPVNASTMSSRTSPHDLGPMWFATPSSCDSYIHYTSSVSTGARCRTLRGVRRVRFTVGAWRQSKDEDWIPLAWRKWPW